MHEAIRCCELFEDLEEEQIERITRIASERSLGTGEYLFLLGDPADSLFVVLSGKIDVCFPFSLEGVMKDISVETREARGALGWSSFVKPYRFTLSARAAEPSEVVVLPRQELLRVLEEDPKLGYAFTRRLSELIGRRLLTMQALWTRELQRTLAGTWATLAHGSPAD